MIHFENLILEPKVVFLLNFFLFYLQNQNQNNKTKKKIQFNHFLFTNYANKHTINFQGCRIFPTSIIFIMPEVIRIYYLIIFLSNWLSFYNIFVIFFMLNKIKLNLLVYTRKCIKQKFMHVTWHEQ